MGFEKILEHFKNPRNYGKIKNADLEIKAENKKCGDIIAIYLKFEGRKIKEIKFEALSCAISKAATSILTEIVKGKRIEEILNFSKKEFLNELKAKIPKNKLDCALLAFNALKNRLQNEER